MITNLELILKFHACSTFEILETISSFHDRNHLPLWNDVLQGYFWRYSQRRKIRKAPSRLNFSCSLDNFSSYVACNLMINIVNNIKKNRKLPLTSKKTRQNTPETRVTWNAIHGYAENQAILGPILLYMHQNVNRPKKGKV